MMHVFRWLNAAAILSVLCITSLSSSSESRRLVFGSDHDYPPYEYLDTQGKPRGFNIDMIQALGKIMGEPIDIRLGPWHVIREQFEQHGTVHISDMFYAPERAERVEFTLPFDIAYDEVFVRRSNPSDCSFETIASHSVIAQRGSSAEDYLRGVLPPERVISVDSEPDALHLLASGFHDCALVTRIAGRLAIKRLNLNNLVSVGKPVRPRDYALVVRKGDLALRDRLNEAIVTLKQSGEYQQIYDRWFGEILPPPPTEAFLRRHGITLLIALAFILLSILLWNRVLNRAVRRRTQALEISQSRWQQLFDHANDAIFILDPVDGRILNANRIALQRYMYTHEELLRLRLHDLGSPGSMTITEAVLARLRDNGSEVFEHIHRDNNGGEFPVEISARLIRFGAEAVIEAFVRDITERRRAEQDREYLVDELERRHAEMEHFVYSISHDLKAPLITISGFARLLDKDLSRGDYLRSRDSLNEIQRAASGMHELIEDLLNLSRTGLLQSEPEPVNLNELLGDIVLRLYAQIDSRRAQILQINPLPTVFADRTRLAQVLQNLLDNALKFCTNDNPALIEIGAEQTPVYFSLYVRDNGIGIPAKYHEKIFGLFQRLDARTEGTGVGLAIVKRIIDNLGGRIWIESTPQQGTTFWISLPVSIIFRASPSQAQS